MITTDEMVRAGAAPFLVALVLAAVGWWRGWGWMGPIAVGMGFLVGVGLLGMPKLPPRDGVDWVFWMAIPAVVLGVVDAIWRPRVGWMMGVMAGVVALVVVGPLVPRVVSVGEVALMAAGVGVVGVVALIAIQAAEGRVGSVAVVGALAIALGGAGVVVMSSNLRIGGVYGMAAAAAMGPVVLLAWRCGVGRSVGIVGMSLLSGVLAGGKYYPEPGVGEAAFWVLMGALVGVVAGVWMPVKKRWVRGVIAVVAVMIVVGVVAGPVAMKAKKEAEGLDPYEAMYR